MSVATFSELMGVSRQTTYSYESGQQLPPPEFIAKAAITLGGLRYEFFFWPIHPDDKLGVLYRSRSSATKTMRLRLRWRYVWLRNVAEYVRSLASLPVPNVPDLNISPDASRDQIEAAASALRKHWQVGNGPISNLTWLLENNGIVIARLDGCSRWHGDNPYIMLASDKDSAARSRSDTGHELLHILARHDPDREYATTERRAMEKQAHHFAGAFLLPAETFAASCDSPSLESFVRMKERWKVSVGMMIARASELQLILPEQARRLWINYTRRGYRRGEPLDDRLEVEEPCLLRDSFELLVKERGREQILAELLYAPRDIEELACLPEGFLEAPENRPQVRLRSVPNLSSATVVPIRPPSTDPE